MLSMRTLDDWRSVHIDMTGHGILSFEYKEAVQEPLCTRSQDTLRNHTFRAAPTKSSLIVTIKVPYYLLNHRQLKKYGFQASKTIWPYKSHKFKLGHNPWAGLGLPKPIEAEVREIHKRLSQYHAKFNFGTFINMAPGEKVVTIDNVIQVILAQNTSNENAIDTHSRLCNTFVYTVEGRKYAGKTPNWHDVRRLSIEELERTLKPTGYHSRRATSIMGVLEAVYAENVKRRAAGIQNFEHDGNPRNAKDFGHGMLSMEFITESAAPTEDILGRLLKLPGIGPKSAMCIIAFHLQRPLFVVDTHVLRYTKWLGWIPRTCDDINLAAMYLHDIVPDDIKYDLHNQIWTHCARENAFGKGGRVVLCAYCGSLPPSRLKLAQYEDMECPVAEFLPPLNERWPKGAWREAENAERRKQDEVVTSRYFSVEKTSQKPKLTRTMAFNDLTPDQARSEGYLLWQFRPLDNSFGEEWGTFEDFPRFKWEKPDIMDPKVAVTYAYAQDVLARTIPHPWSRYQS